MRDGLVGSLNSEQPLSRASFITFHLDVIRGIPILNESRVFLQWTLAREMAQED